MGPHMGQNETFKNVFMQLLRTVQTERGQMFLFSMFFSCCGCSVVGNLSFIYNFSLSVKIRD